MFVDEARVILKAGKGGDGCLSFLREKYRPNGGPNGGDGGNGGSVILVCDRNVSDLTDYKFMPHAEAKDGGPGRGSRCHGANGADCFLKVPQGTVVVNNETGAVAVELIEDGEQVVLLKGGIGGKGNYNFKSSVNQAPRKITKGTAGECGEFTFILKTIADIGLVGFPNAGKSSLINILTNAQQKSAPYPFTTLNPKVGVISFDDENTTLTIADIPGLIHDAHKNKGLGIQFLKHIERCKTLLFVIDVSGSDGRDPFNDLQILRAELEQYDHDLLKKKQLIVANKLDIESFKENYKNFCQKVKMEFNQVAICISCETQEGISELKSQLLKITV